MDLEILKYVTYNRKLETKDKLGEKVLQIKNLSKERILKY